MPNRTTPESQPPAERSHSSIGQKLSKRPFQLCTLQTDIFMTVHSLLLLHLSQSIKRIYVRDDFLENAKHDTYLPCTYSHRHHSFEFLKRIAETFLGENKCR